MNDSRKSQKENALSSVSVNVLKYFFNLERMRWL